MRRWIQLRPLIGPAPVRRKVDKLSTIRLGSARYSVPTALIGTQVGVLVDGARVLILDEPTASLDDSAATAALQLLQGSAQALGATLVIATHDARVTSALPGAKTHFLGGFSSIDKAL